MKKLDEIMELMTDEMHDFKTAVLQLEVLSKQLLEHSIPISTQAIRETLDVFLKKQEVSIEKYREDLLSVKQMLENARVIPNYQIKLFLMLGIMMLGSLFYFGYSAQVNEKEKFKVYQMISDSENRQYERFLNEDPAAKEKYCAWLEEKK